MLRARSDQIVLVFGEKSGGEFLRSNVVPLHRLSIFQLRGHEGGPSLIESNEVCRSWVVLVMVGAQQRFRRTTRKHVAELPAGRCGRSKKPIQTFRDAGKPVGVNAFDLN